MTNAVENTEEIFDESSDIDITIGSIDELGDDVAGKVKAMIDDLHAVATIAHLSAEHPMPSEFIDKAAQSVKASLEEFIEGVEKPTGIIVFALDGEDDIKTMVTGATPSIAKLALAGKKKMLHVLRDVGEELRRFLAQREKNNAPESEALSDDKVIVNGSKTLQ